MKLLKWSSCVICICLFCDFLPLIYSAHAYKVTAAGIHPTSISLWVMSHSSERVCPSPVQGSSGGAFQCICSASGRDKDSLHVASPTSRSSSKTNNIHRPHLALLKLNVEGLTMPKTKTSDRLGLQQLWHWWQLQASKAVNLQQTRWHWIWFYCIQTTSNYTQLLIFFLFGLNAFTSQTTFASIYHIIYLPERLPHDQRPAMTSLTLYSCIFFFVNNFLCNFIYTLKPIINDAQII